MDVRISYHPQFSKDAKRLSKKYKSLISDLKDFVSEIKNNPELGTDLGHGLRKVRISIASKGKGKSGGGRIITYKTIVTEEGYTKIILLTMYDKTEIENVSDVFLRSLIHSVIEH